VKKLIILDRDGVINQDSPDYIKSPDEFIFLPGSIQAIVRLHKAGYTLAIATNQSGVARGYYNEATLHAVHEKLLAHVHVAGGEISCIQSCLHLPSAACSCRKPMPGMLYEIAKKLGCTLEGAMMIGDRMTDILAAKAAAVWPMLVMSSMTDSVCLASSLDIPVFQSLEACANNILSAA
jgi:D-glycero-D-manno-heptose 1,7-bisphosphate phosphatase